MNLTPSSMEDVIMRNIGDVNTDPHLKKLLEELNSLKQEIYGKKQPTKNETAKKNNSAEKDIVIPRNTLKKPRKPRGGDAAVFGERRKSDRLTGEVPKYHLMDDIDEVENKKLYSNGQLRLSGEGIGRRSFTSVRRFIATERVILEPEEITPEMLNNICYQFNDKIYDTRNGSSCHQCRQKTRDTKTICRNLDCVGVRGQVCGPCAKNRYGVDVKEALLDPYWSCFVCQGICNCSFCRSRKGKRPTGILAHIAKREGHESVKDFLDDLRKGLSEEDDYNEFMQDPESVIGFVDHKSVCTLGGEEELFQGKEADKMSEIKINKLHSIMESLAKN